MKIFDRLSKAFRRLPGVGPRQAERFCAYFLKASTAETEEFITALREMKDSIKLCKRCFNYADGELCPICADTSRDQSLICVVEDPQDIEAIEKTRTFGGLYHVLHGSLSPMDGVSPDVIKFRELEARISAPGANIQEIIIATDPDTEGEATALFLAQSLRERVARITRIAYGVPLGGDLDYTDEMTLGYALKGRTRL